MKAIQCEMCCSNDIIKQDGLYVCQHCGTKYSVEEAKKLFFESTVKIDKSDELKSLYEVARRARKDNDIDTALKYYEKILTLDSGWEPYFYSIYYQSLRFTSSQIKIIANRIKNCENTVLTLIKDSIHDENQMRTEIKEICIKIGRISTSLFNSSLESYKSLLPVMVNYCQAALDIVYFFGDYVIEIFGREFGKNIAIGCWKFGIEKEKCLIKNSSFKKTNNSIIGHMKIYESKLQEFEPSYSVGELKSVGCYVATCVYGSYDCPQVWTLRRYRDYTLSSTWYGRAFIRAYYAISPMLVKWFGKTKWFKGMWQAKLDRMVKKLNAKGVEDTPYQDKQW